MIKGSSLHALMNFLLVGAVHMDGPDQTLCLFIAPRHSAIPLTILRTDKATLSRLLDLLFSLAIALPGRGWPHNLVFFGDMEASNLI